MAEMKITVKTIAGARFQIDVKRDDFVADVKKNIENVQGSTVYPAARQVLLHQGNILKDKTTLGDNNISENSFMFILLRKRLEMEITVKTLAGTRFKIEANVTTSVKYLDTTMRQFGCLKVADVKKNIETVQGPNVYPAAQQVLLHHGNILKDETTLEENNITKNSFMVVMLCKTKSSASRSSTTSSSAPASVVQPKNSIAPSTQFSPASQFVSSEPVTESIDAPVSVPVLSPSSGSAAVTNLHGRAESCKAAGTDPESNIQHLLYLGKGNWDRETVTHALHAASNDRRKAVQYILFGDLEEDDIPPEARTPTPAFAFVHQPVAASGGLNAAPLDLFPQRTSNVDLEARACILESWRNSECFQAFRTTVQANPHRLLPMLQDLSKVNRGLLRVIQKNLIDFIRLLNEPVEREGNVPRQLAESMPTESMSITSEENGSIKHGIPDEAAMSPVAQVAPQPAAVSDDPNTNPLDLSPQGLKNVDSIARAHIMDFIRNDQDFQAVRPTLQAYPEILQPMLHKLGEKNPNFSCMINEPVESHDNVHEQLPEVIPTESLSSIPEKYEPVERIVGDGSIFGVPQGSGISS